MVERGRKRERVMEKDSKKRSMKDRRLGRNERVWDRDEK